MNTLILTPDGVGSTILQRLVTMALYLEKMPVVTQLKIPRCKTKKIRLETLIDVCTNFIRLLKIIIGSISTTQYTIFGTKNTYVENKK
jgi:hypothetical protein